MDQRTRMVKTLAYLVVAMTGTSMLLGWLDPSLPPSAGALSNDVIIHLAREAVTQDVEILGDEWAEVRVGLDARTLSSTLLAAPAGRADWHFLVGVDGRPSRAVTWQSQEQVPGSPHVVHIHVVEAIDGGLVSSAQWLCVRALIASLDRAAGQGGETLPVQFDDSIDRLYVDHRLIHASMPAPLG